MNVTAKPWDQTTRGDVLAVIHNYDELLMVLLRLKEARGFTHEELEHRIGIAAGTVDKIFGPRRIRNLGPTWFGLFLAGLGITLAVVVDEVPVPTRPRRHSQARPTLNAHQLPAVAA